MTSTKYRVLGIAVLVVGICAAYTPLAHADTVGDTHTFYSNSTYDASGSSTISATLRAVGQKAYLYIDDRFWSLLSNNQRNQLNSSLQELSSAFDTNIYPTATGFWGTENTPGVDGDPHVTILFERLTSGIGGYFETINGYPQSQVPGSNAREMFYIRADSALGGAGGAGPFIAHEFQHLISFYQKDLLFGSDDDTWLNEARSEYDITLTGYNTPFDGSTLQRREQVFMSTPSDSLVEWPNTAVDYAIATMFTHYLADQFSPALLQSTIHSRDDGVVAVDDWLAVNDPAERFGDAFSDWMVAAVLNDRSVGPRYGYITSGLDGIRVSPQQMANVDGSGASSVTQMSLKEWQPSWTQFNVPSFASQPALTVQINGPQGTSWSGATIAAYGDGHRMVSLYRTPNGQATLSVPTTDAGAHLVSVTLALTQGTVTALGNRTVTDLPVTLTAALGQAVATPAPTPVPSFTPTPSGALKDGDLMHHGTDPSVYVIWGKYRRYLAPGVLELYGFQNRPISTVSDDIFNLYTTSNYIRAFDGTRVYAVWPDGTKHWLNITPAQWDASGRDWNAIFIVNDAEVNFYHTGVDITR